MTTVDTPPVVRDEPAAPRLRSLRRERLLSLLIALLVSLGSLAVVFTGADVGTADNFDGARLMCPAGFGLVEGRHMTTAEFEYHRLPDAEVQACRADDYHRYVTSAALLVRAWPAVDRVLAPEPGLDLRTLAVLYAVLFGLAFAALFRCLPGGSRFRFLGTLGAAVALLDVAFVSYFASPYSEPTGLIGLVLSVAALSAYLRSPRPGRRHLVWVVLALGLTVTAKLQLFTLAVVVVPLLLSRRVGPPRLGGSVRGRMLPAAAAAVLLVLTGGVMRAQGQSYHDVNTYNVLFWAVLPSSPDPGAELARLGLPPEYAKYSGTHYWQPEGHGLVSQQWRTEAEPLSRTTVLVPVFAHPSRAVTMFRHGVEGAVAMRPPNLSNVESRFEIVRTPSTTSALLGRFGRLPWPVLPTAWLLAAALGLGIAVRPRVLAGARSGAWRVRQVRAAGLLVAALGAFATSQVAVSVFGDGYSELEKHTTFADAATGMIAGLALGWLAAFATRGVRR